MGPKPKHTTTAGAVFGRWTVISQPDPNSQKRWLCRCECGLQKIVVTRHLTTRQTTQCLECSKTNRIGALKHGDTKNRTISAEYQTWLHIKARCYNPNNSHWYRYGGRGITVCERWMVFEYFLSDIGRKPTTKHTIERIDNNGDYSPDNCKWATYTEQARNRSHNVHITANGKTMLLTDWAKETGISYGTISARLKRGLSQERAVNEPIRHTRWE
jgi:hypothetical protein